MASANSPTVNIQEVIVPVVRRYVRHFLGRTPESIDVQSVNGLLIVHLTGVLSESENRLYQADPSPAGQEMVEQVFRRLVRQTRDSLTGALGAATNWAIRSVLCDVDCATGDAILVLIHDD